MRNVINAYDLISLFNSATNKNVLDLSEFKKYGKIDLNTKTIIQVYQYYNNDRMDEEKKGDGFLLLVEGLNLKIAPFSSYRPKWKDYSNIWREYLKNNHADLYNSLLQGTGKEKDLEKS